MAKTCIGLDIGSSSIKAVQIKRSRTGVALQAFGMQPLVPQTIVDGTIMDHVAEHFKEHSADIWFDWSAEKLLPPGTKCPTCGAASFENLQNAAMRGDVALVQALLDAGVDPNARSETMPRSALAMATSMSCLVKQAEPAARLVPIPLGMPLEEVEQRLIEETLRRTKGDKELAAKLLGIASRTIYRKLKERGSASA